MLSTARSRCLRLLAETFIRKPCYVFCGVFDVLYITNHSLGFTKRSQNSRSNLCRLMPRELAPVFTVVEANSAGLCEFRNTLFEFLELLNFVAAIGLTAFVPFLACGL